MASFTYLDEEKPDAGFTYLDEAPPKPKQNTGIAGDIGTALKRGVLQIPGMATGLADIAAAPVSIATGVNRPVSRAADWLGEQTGLQFGKWAEAAGAEYSPAMQQAQQNVEQAKGFLPTIGAVVQNPRVAAQVVAESLPSTLAGGLLARGAMGAVAGAEKLTALRAAAGSADAAVANAARRELLKSGAIAAGIGEGAITAGQQMAQTGYDVDPALAAGTALGAGIGTGVIGGLSGRVAGSAFGRRLGLSDIETSMAAGTLGENASKAGIAGAVKRIGAGVVQEGLLEEAPQSYQEQVWQNIAAGKPWSEGAAEAAALGAAAGGVMGGAVNAIPRSAQPAEQPPAVQPIAQELAAAARIPDPQVNPVAAINHPASGAIVKATAEGVLSGAIPPNTPATPATPAAPPTAAVVAPTPKGLVAGVPITETTPAAPGADAPVSTAATSLTTNQVEPAGVPTTGPTADASNQAQIAVPPAQGSEAQPATGAVAGEVRQGIAAAALPPLQYPKQTASIAGPLPQTATAMPVGRFGAPVQQPKKPAQKFVRPPLTAKAQPSETSVLPQTAAQMPVGRFGERAKGVEAKPTSDAEKYARIKAMPQSQRSDEDIAFANAYWRKQKEPEIRAKEDAESARLAAENDTDGFAESKSQNPALRQRIRNALNRVVSSNGRIISRKALVRDAVKSGSTIAQRENQRSLLFPNGAHNTEQQLSKTAMDYAEFLIAKRSAPGAEKPLPINAVDNVPETKFGDIKIPSASTNQDPASDAVRKTKQGNFVVGDKVTDIYLNEDGRIIAIDENGVATIANDNGTDAKSDGSNLTEYVLLETSEGPLQPTANVPPNVSADISPSEGASDMPKRLADLTETEKRIYEFDKRLAASKQRKNLNVTVSDEINDRGTSFTPEMLMYGLVNSLGAVNDLDGKLRSRNRTGATVGQLLTNWVSYRQTQNEIAASREENPDLWAAYDARQKQVSAAQVGEKLFDPYPSAEYPFGQPVVLVAKFAKNWRVKRDDGQVMLQDPRVLRPAVSPAARQEPKQTAAKPRKSPDNSISADRDSLLVAIAKLGGMSTGELTSNGFDQKDITRPSASRISRKTSKTSQGGRKPISFGFNMPLHRKIGGLSFDGVLEALKQYGYFPESASVNDVIDAVRGELGGRTYYTPEAIDRQATMDADERNAELAAQQDLIDAELAAEREIADSIELDAESEAAQDAIELFDDAFDIDAPSASSDERAFLISMGMTEEEADAELNESRQAQPAGAGEVQAPVDEAPAAGPGEGGSQGVQGGKAESKGDGRPGLALQGQTPEEIKAASIAAEKAAHDEMIAKAAEARKEKAAKDKAEKDRRAAEVLKEREAAKKAEVDNAAEEFALGQAAPEPVVKKVTTEDARGQKDVFDQPAPARGNDTLRNMQPYVVRFMEDVKAGSVTIGEAKGGSKDATQTTGTTGGESLPGVPAKSVQKDDAGANDGDIRPEQGGGGAGSDGGTARPGVPAVGGVGGGKGRSVPGRGRPKRGADGNGGDIPATPPNQPDPVKSGLTDYVITSETLLGEGGAKTKFKNNIAAIRLINELDDSARPVTREDQDVLARYVGWGMLPQAFDAKNGDWSKEYSELKGLLTEEEWNEAYMSTQYAHYTSEEIITNGVYAALDRLGFSGGKILEPGSGVGNFVGLMPQSLRTAGSRVTGIERERISAKIGQYLYPTHNMLQADFTEFKAPDGYFDAAIGNPPFSATALTDASGRKHLSGLSVHNYFFAKSVDQLRPGGVFAMVVSNSFLDAQKDSARRYIGERTKFLGAIRLPNNAFKKNAGTDVTTDLIFLQKLKESDVASKATKEAAKSWMETSQIPDPLGGENIPLNDYYIAHPEMMLGRMERSGKMYRAASAALVANEGSDITTQLREAVALLPANVYVAPSLSSTDKALDSAVVALEDDTVQPGGMYTKDGDLYVRLQDEAGEKLARKLTADYQWTEKTVLGENRLERLKAIAELRSTVRNLLAAEIKDDAKAMKQLRSQLNTQYDAIVSRWDFLSSSGTVQLIGDDPDYPLLAALETDYDKGITAYAAKKNGIAPVKPSAKKMAIFTQRVIPKHEEVTKAETPVDALMVSIFERGHIDQQYISSLLGGRDGKEVIDELVEQGHLFFDPESDRHVLKDEYLSGDVRRKLKIAQASGLNANARALEKVIPEDVPSHNIIGTMGASWISNEIYQDFINEQLGEGTVSRVKYSPAAGSFVVEINAGSDFINTNTLGINMDGGRAADLIEKILNKKQAKIGHYEDGKFILDKESTDQAADKITEIKTRFGDWLFKDADRSEVLTRAYNDTVNNYVVREFDGSMLTFPGKVPDSIIKFRRHQRNAIARILQSGQALLDHVVGAGKTFTVIAAAMEMRRTGIAHKPMVTVPNHLVKQWASDFYRLYPGAKVLAATKNDFARENRRAFLAKIATGDWDAVIIAHSTFGFIQPEKQFEIEFNGAQIKDITDAINELGGEVGDKGDARDKGTKRTVKQLAKMREKLQERIKALRQKPMDNLLDLAELGIDALFVDEAHKFKNLMYTTKMQGVRVGGDPSGSQRAYDMYIKTQQVMKKSGGRGVVFATGTPISNTMAEMYHVLRYLAPKTLTDMGLKTFDAWADAFASAETFWMQSMSGDGYKASTRLEKFINVPSLLRIYDQVADTVTMEDIKDAYRSENKGKEFPIPPVKGGGARSAVSIKRSQAQTEYMQEIASRAKALEQRKGPPQKGQDNMLSIMGDARKAAMDMRLVDKSITERDPNGRIAVAAENVWERYKQYNSVKGTQLIFSDMGTPKKSAAKEMEEYNQLKARADRADDSALQDRATLGDEDAIAAIEDAEEAAAEIEKKGKDWADAIQAAIRGFSIYDDMKEALMEKGIPENEIAFIHSYNTDDQKAALFKAVNSGVIRVLLGSTEKMGAGTNVQERVVALHHLDVPWRPSDVEQREGRVVRQGNKLLGLIKGFEVEIMAYATQDTLDLYMWQTQENKLKMIGQLRTGNVDFEMDNAFEEMAFSAGEMQAAATSNPYLLDEIRVKDQIKKLERKKRSYEGQRNDIINRSAKAKRDVSVLPAEIQTAADIADGERGYRSKLDADNKALTISVNGTDVTGIDNIRKATGAALDAMRDIVVVTVGGTDFKVRSLDQLQDAIKASQKKGDINRIAFDGKEYDLNVWGGVVSNGADAIDAALDKTVSEKIKASGFELGGKEYKSYSSLMDGLRTLIGDREPIKFSVAGQDIIQRSKIKSAVSEALAKAVDGESRELLGKFGDVQVYVEAIPDRKDKSKIILNAQVEYNGSGMNGDVLPAGVWDAAVEPSLAKLMGERVIDKARQIMLNASSNEQSARERLAQARRTLADIESNKIDDEWPGEQELKAARAKHDKVLRQLSGRANKQEPKGPVDDLAAKAERMPPIDDRLYNVAATAAPSPSDSAVYQMAQEGKPASEILAFLAKASRRPFNRVLAVALQKAGLQTSITVDPQGGWSVGNRSYAAKYAAAYSPKADKVALFTPREAERHVLHELTHAATLKAINAGGAAAMRMTALFKHIEKSGKLEGMYGMSTLDEFVAEVFSNPKFRAALESVPAPAGSTLKTAWDWFVRIVARVLGFQHNGPHTALDRALRDGVALMEENAAIRAQATGGDRYGAASTKDAKEASEYEARLFGGSYDNNRLRGAPKDAPIRKMIANARQRYNELRKSAGLQEISDWTKAPKARVTDVDNPRYSADDLPPTITINGVERPTTNSNGKPIHPTAEGVRSFWRWFGESRVTDSEGRPIVLYHGTVEDFSVFDLEETRNPAEDSGIGFFFATRPKEAEFFTQEETDLLGSRSDKFSLGANVVPVFLAIRNPKIYATQADMFSALNDAPYSRDGRGDALYRQLTKKGFDGVVVEDSMLEGKEGGRWVIAFDPEQIKSATANTGAFSPDDPDIRYNLAANWPTSALPQAKAIRDTVATALRSDANTSWITPFNTQYHKAEKWAADGKPLFKRVFNLVQQFLGDVSKYAVMAQNAAPTLLHEWRTVSDVKAALSGGDLVGRKHRADIAAVAMPLYDGTLYGGGNPMNGIKWSDERLRTKYKLTDRQIKLYHEALAAVNVSMDEMAKSVIAQHAKREKVGFDSGMDIDDMSAGVLSNLEDKKQEIMESVGEIAQESVNAQIADLKEMDRPDEADKLNREFDKAKKDAKAGLERIDKTIGDINGIVAKNKALQAAGYFPLMRFGKHTVTARDKDGKVQFFGMYDGIPLVPGSGQAEANRVAAQLKEEFPDWDVTTGIVNDQKYKLYQGVNLDALQLFAEHMEKDDVEPFQEFVRMATNNRSAQRRLLHRKGTPGFDKDVRRTMAQFITSNARATSSNYHTQDMLRAAAEAEADGGDIGAEAIKLVKYVQDPIEEAQALRGFLFFNFLGGSIASAMVNLTQTPAMTLPYLSKFEQAPALMRRTMAAARMAAGKPETIADQNLRHALMRAELDGVTAPQEIHQLMATAANNIFAGSRAANILLRGWGAPFSMAESFNRRIAFITAFKIGEGMGNSIKNKTGFDNAFDFAEDVVKQTQGIYNKGNRMNIGRGAVGATLLTFKQYSVMYLELLKRLPPKQRAIMVGVLLLSAGAGGLPGVDDLEDLWDTVGQWLGYATNSKRSIRNSLTEFAGAPMADVVLNGVLSRMGIDLHSRLGMQNLIPGTGILKQSSTDKGRDIEEFFGPAASVIKSAGDALENMATGRPGKAAMAVSPVAIRNAALGGKMAATGFAQDASGRNTVPVNEAEAFAKGIGFNPKSVAEFGSVKRDLAQDQRLVGVKREEFAAAMADAVLNNDPEARLQAIKDLQEWNQNNPLHRVTITPESIAKRVRDARAEGATRMLRSLPKGMRTQAAEEFRQ